MFLEHRIVTIRCPLENFTNKLTVNHGRIKILKGLISIFFQTDMKPIISSRCSSGKIASEIYQTRRRRNVSVP